MSGWYTRPVFYVRDATAALGFYTARLGFTEAWRHEDKGELLIVQVNRDDCEIILTGQWPDKAGSGLVFVSLEPDEFAAAEADLAERGARAEEGWWGYKLLVIKDPDGNQIWMPRPEEGA